MLNRNQNSIFKKTIAIIVSYVIDFNYSGSAVRRPNYIRKFVIDIYIFLIVCIRYYIVWRGNRGYKTNFCFFTLIFQIDFFIIFLPPPPPNLAVALLSTTPYGPSYAIWFYHVCCGVQAAKRVSFYFAYDLTMVDQIKSASKNRPFTWPTFSEWLLSLKRLLYS